MRGTPEAYEKVVNKDKDTLYFISAMDADDGCLYLGEKLISNTNGDPVKCRLSELKDVFLREELINKSVLVYDSSRGWVDVEPDKLVFIGASADANGLAGYVPAPLKGQTNLFLRSDGVWAEIAVNEAIVVDNNIITIENATAGTAHSELINEAVKDLAIKKGDMIIIQDLIYYNAETNDKKWEHTAYVYDGNVWAAMDGNYNAENVYFDQDFIFTEKIGTVKTLTNGRATKAAAGMNVRDFFASLFAVESQPSITSPSYSLSASAILEDTAEIGNYISGYSWDGSWSAGSYGYGSKENTSTSTGIIPTYVVSEDQEDQTATTLDGTFSLENPIQINAVGAKDYATITGVCSYPDSPYVPVTNIGNAATTGSLKGKTITKTASASVTGYRSSFYYIGEDNESPIDSDFIRAGINKNQNTKDFGTVEIPAGTKRILFAIPGVATLSEVKDIKGMGLDIKGNFTKATIAVEGANHYAAADYTVFYTENANGLSATEYAVTIV